MTEPAPPSYAQATAPVEPGPQYGQTAYAQPTYGQSGYGQPAPAGYGYQGEAFKQPSMWPPPPVNTVPPPATAYNAPPSQGYAPPPQQGAFSMHAEEEPKDDNGSDEPVWDTGLGSFSDKAIRRSFIKKVFLILMVQLLVTSAIIAVFLLVEPVQYWITRNSWCYYVSYGVFLVTYIVLVCIPSVRRNFPGNYIALAVFTLAFSYMTGTIASFYTAQAVLIAAGITCVVCLALSIFAIQTKIDFTMCSGLLFCLCMVLFFFGWSCMLVWFVSYQTAMILQCVYGALGALVMSLFLCYDIQMLVGGKNRKFQLSPEEYIFGALQIYLDVVYIFIFILMIFFGGSKN